MIVAKTPVISMRSEKSSIIIRTLLVAKVKLQVYVYNKRQNGHHLSVTHLSSLTKLTT